MSTNTTEIVNTNPAADHEGGASPEDRKVCIDKYLAAAKAFRAKYQKKGFYYDEKSSEWMKATKQQKADNRFEGSTCQSQSPVSVA
ncbi:MAG: hypothetical protein RLY93_02210 [Sumerlaeia bacterium]